MIHMYFIEMTLAVYHGNKLLFIVIVIVIYGDNYAHGTLKHFGKRLVTGQYLPVNTAVKTGYRLKSFNPVSLDILDKHAGRSSISQL